MACPLNPSVAGSGPWTGPGPVKRPGPRSIGPDRDHKNFGPVPGPGPGPLPMGNLKGLLRTGLDWSLCPPKDQSQNSLFAPFGKIQTQTKAETELSKADII